MPLQKLSRNQPECSVSDPRAVIGTDDLIIRYHGPMRTISATEASRRFSDLLDAIEAGETIRVTRGNRPIAEIRPALTHNGRELREALEGSAPPDEHFAESIAEAVGLLTMEGEDPWVGG